MDTHRSAKGLRKTMLAGLLAASLMSPLAAAAQEAPVADAGQQAPSDSAMVNLVRALVAQGALKAEMGDQLIRQAEAEAQQVRARREMPAPVAGAIRVPYIPESVRTQIKEELRAEVMQEARSGGWAAPDEAAPDWTRRLAIHGDIRVRSQSDLYSRTNADDIIDYATINALSPYGIDDPRLLLPILNSRNDQWNRMRLRARIGLDVTVAKGVTAGITLATGDNEGPISTNATLGGGFFKRDLWLDKAWLKIEPARYASLTFGRFGNPFNSSDLLYDPDLNLDGAAVELNSADLLGEDVRLAVRGGAFPFDFGSPNWPAFAFSKPTAPQKYLFAGEFEAKAKIEDFDVKLSAGYHRFENFQGDLSTPCQTEVESFCSTDHLQPLYLTKGNTLSPLRQIVTLTPNADLPQLLGYTFKYQVLDVNASVSAPFSDSALVRLSGAFVKNLGFDKGDICRNGLAGRPYNNAAAGGAIFCAATNPAKFAGGDTGYRGELLLGRPDARKQGEWNVFGGYRYLESDAVLDALTDSDFHMGGTNSKGWFLGGAYALRDGLTIGGRWMSANEISGSPLAIDVLQIDLQAKF